MKAALSYFVIAVFLSCSSIVSLAATTPEKSGTEIYDIPKLIPVQNRAYINGSGGFTLQAGYLPVDPFNKSVIVGAAFTYNLSDFTTWEVVNFCNAINLETDLRSDLKLVAPDRTPENTHWLEFVKWYATTGLLYTPFYNKHLLFNKTVLHSEFTFVIDTGVAQFEGYDGIRPVVGGGIILKYFLSQSTALKFDFREQIYFGKNGTNGLLSLILGFQYQFGSRTSDLDL